MGAATWIERRHAVFHSRMEEEGITIEWINPPIPVRHMDYVAYRDPEGLCGYGSSAEDAYLHLMELEEG